MKFIAKKIQLAVFLLAAIALFSGLRFWHGQKERQAGGAILKNAKPIDYTGQSLQKDATMSFRREYQIADKTPVAGITSHHLPTAESFINEFYLELLAARPDIKEFLIVGPDHFERCKNLISTTPKSFLTPFGVLENHPEITRAMLDAGAGEDSSCFVNEHSVGVETAFIKKYFPDAKASALIFSSAASGQIPEKLAKTLAEKFPDAVAIASVDFSHYQSADAANAIDATTEKQIKMMDTGNLKLEQVDSPASLRFVVAYALYFKALPDYIKHANSSDFTNNFGNTTGYFNVIFGLSKK